MARVACARFKGKVPYAGNLYDAAEDVINRRAGDSIEGIVVVPGMDSIDASAIYAALIASGAATVEIFTDGDLSTKTARSKLEKAEIKAAMASNIILLNNDGCIASQRLELRIAYLERELAAPERPKPL